VVTAVQELHERGVAFVSLKEGLDLSTAAGRLQLHILSALGQFERDWLIERTRAGLARAPTRHAPRPPARSAGDGPTRERGASSGARGCPRLSRVTPATCDQESVV
jgi:DNA invertase Pin-like site-specific DNA recombinase